MSTEILKMYRQEGWIFTAFVQIPLYKLTKKD